MLTEDQSWVHEHFDDLVDKYAGKYISVAGGELAAVADSVKGVTDAARAKHPGVMPSILRIPTEENFECLRISAILHAQIKSQHSTLPNP